MNALDRLVSFFAPRAGIKRALARRALEQVRAYEGANRKDGWRPRRAGASANADHRAGASELRNRARSLAQNSPHSQADHRVWLT